MSRIWPKSLAGRLIALLVAALAIAQGVVVFVIHDEQRGIVEAMAHGQALNQTVTLARLLAHYPPSEAGRLVAAFGSRSSCARLIEAAPAASDPELDGAERHLTEILGRMLHGDFTGPPRVTVQRSDLADFTCDDGMNTTSPYADRKAEDRAPIHLGSYSAEAVVPLKDGRTLMFRTLIEAPPLPAWVAFLSFLLSSSAIAAVVVIAVRRQTRALGDLASAAERFGRGDEVPALPEVGSAEIVAATHAFNTMQERLRRFVSERLRLLAAVSHDLRTPLTTLRLKAEFIDDEAARDDMVATIEELTAITEATLAFTRAEASHEETKTVDLARLVEDVVDEFRLGAAAVEVETPGPVRYDCRPVALKRAVRNLVENAVRYGGAARVALRAGGEGPSIVVEDDGPGLPADRIEDAFRPFVRLEPSRNAETGGLGLGLAIARGIVQAHGGQVVLTNRPERGLRAELRLPARDGR
ncbi:ATP-binding protein [Pinisolibacter aquiterrae]|uniref:ATP-binding protein n=1 Tax=Pinisolibacter aquiterrae TaxID=2815579 RepID=UPI001C3E2D7B|nr:ATP-binding protein [Pinisolibacter aquiterrae]MBV5264823.1 HAMP domain-containing protein [Pinisolibacter aquiterrae]MCC8234242.1 HAMP domain-containing protein [Pinisolibacter aquiterrae]